MVMILKVFLTLLWFEVKDVDRSEWMNVADKGESKSVGNVVELATTSILAPTVLEMEMVVFHPPNKLTVCCKLHMKITLKW